ncbi:Exodeoxyribonuclease 7 large subunit [uncultured delta proteobacterium]|uniref:Exodeoxyribonuclease 7 large subunit n=1 Tax=uncultured delta proteobacterium TaxID=34034 RepID=A0A212J0S3_9DELT|nr:Exodeoxyribonuclease 7 large subunit [uncultured delta proteobacterium]
MSDAILTVGQLTRAVKGQLEGNFPFVWVRGQVSNCSRPGSGHLYFSLKDDEAILNAVWFKGSQKSTEAFDPLTGEVFEDGPRPGLAASLENGQEIICAGKLTVYPPRGSYQLVVEIAQDAGVGRLQLEFERIKAALLQKGYFDTARKRLLPHNPVRVAVVTAVTGAAIRDFLRVGAERGLGGEVRVYPALVQGNEAPAQIASALGCAAADGWAEVIVLIRGGGSLEDLWAFNTEIVADAVFASPVPVLAGIGHEVDVSIADMVADVRAATPTHAAQLLWTERRELAQRVDEVELHLQRVWQTGMAWREGRLAALAKALTWLSPERTLARWDERLANLTARLGRAAASNRERAVHTLQLLERRLPQAFTAALAAREHGVERLSLRLEGLDPLRPLERGYALARSAKGAFVRSVTDVAPGDGLDLILRDGSVPVRVETSNPSSGK